MFNQLAPTSVATTSYADPFADAPIISSYTMDEAIEDGVLIDLRVAAPTITREHYSAGPLPRIVCTTGVWDLVQRAIAHPRWLNDLNGVLHDIFWMSRLPVAAVLRAGTPDSARFRVIITGTGRRSTHTLFADVGVVCDDDRHTPVGFSITFRLPDEN